LKLRFGSDPKEDWPYDPKPMPLERQANMSLAEMLSDLPNHCAVGTKRNAKGHTTSWIGYKLHLDVADGDIPVSGLLSSASFTRQPGGDPADVILRWPETALPVLISRFS
jgi:hypothetical protein